MKTNTKLSACVLLFVVATITFCSGGTGNIEILSKNNGTKMNPKKNTGVSNKEVAKTVYDAGTGDENGGTACDAGASNISHPGDIEKYKKLRIDPRQKKKKNTVCGTGPVRTIWKLKKQLRELEQKN